MYSRLQMEIEALKDDAKLGADSVIAYLRKRSVKAEEIRWSGIQAFLQGKKSVTKAELMEFVQGNELRVEDVRVKFCGALKNYLVIGNEVLDS
ncbi:MAG: hypothetical protein ACOX62_08005 [Christensenellales bacterium]|jgi:hypothetical protein